MDTFAKRLMDARISKHLTREQLAQRLGLPRGYREIWRYETGQVLPRENRRQALADALGVNIAWLMYGAGRRK